MKNLKFTTKTAIALSTMLMAVFSGCNPFFSQDDIVFEKDYCGWKVVKWQYDANLNVNCHWMILEKGNERKEVYVTKDVAMKYTVGDTMCVSKHSH